MRERRVPDGELLVHRGDQRRTEIRQLGKTSAVAREQIFETSAFGDFGVVFGAADNFLEPAKEQNFDAHRSHSSRIASSLSKAPREALRQMNSSRASKAARAAAQAAMRAAAKAGGTLASFLSRNGRKYGVSEWMPENHGSQLNGHAEKDNPQTELPENPAGGGAVAQQERNGNHGQEFDGSGDVAVAPGEIAAPDVVPGVEKDISHQQPQPAEQISLDGRTKALPNQKGQQEGENEQRVEQEDGFLGSD